MSPQPPQRLEKILARVAREQSLDQERLRRWVSFLALCGVLEQGVERGVIDTYYVKGGVAMELRFALAARTTKDFDLGLVGNRAERVRKLEGVLNLGSDAFTFRVPGPTSDVCILTANGTSGSVDAIATPSISVHSIQVGQGVGLAFGSETVSIATSLTSQGYLTMFGTTLSATSVDMQSRTLVGGGTIEGPLTNNGYLSSTNGETLTVAGDYTQTAGGELSVNFGTTYPPALVVKSNVTLSGTLSVGVNLRRPPSKGSYYTAITFGSHNGEFTSSTVEGGGSVKYNNHSVVVTFNKRCSWFSAPGLCHRCCKARRPEPQQRGNMAVYCEFCTQPGSPNDDAGTPRTAAGFAQLT